MRPLPSRPKPSRTRNIRLVPKVDSRVPILSDAPKRGDTVRGTFVAMSIPIVLAVFGVADQWAKTFEDIYDVPPTWYQGEGRDPTSTAWVVSSLDSSSRRMQTTMFTPPRSSSRGSGGGWGSGGFPGGGSSGGGSGGGGGSSWWAGACPSGKPG
jgi:uncharacterized membrane protein YgcG